MSRKIVKWAAGAAVLAMSMAAQAGNNGVVVSVAPEKASLGKSDDVVVKVTFTNTSGSPQYVLKSHTPFEGVDAPLFEVTRDGQPVRYLGRIVKRGPLSLDDYVELAPHSAHTHTIDITHAYAFRPGTHTYVIRYEGSALADVRQLDSAAGLQTGALMFSHTQR